MPSAPATHFGRGTSPGFSDQAVAVPRDSSRVLWALLVLRNRPYLTKYLTWVERPLARVMVKTCQPVGDPEGAMTRTTS